jgi:putative tricarboxylic transport membrane protein
LLARRLAFGIPGDAVTAVMLGAMTIDGSQSGPLFISQQPQLSYGIYAAHMLTICWVFVPIVIRVTSVRLAVLAPIVMVLCVLGAYALNNTMQSVDVLMIFGVVGKPWSRSVCPWHRAWVSGTRSNSI